MAQHPVMATTPGVMPAAAGWSPLATAFGTATQLGQMTNLGPASAIMQATNGKTLHCFPNCVLPNFRLKNFLNV